MMVSLVLDTNVESEDDDDETDTGSEEATAK